MILNNGSNRENGSLNPCLRKLVSILIILMESKAKHVNVNSKEEKMLNRMTNAKQKLTMSERIMAFQTCWLRRKWKMKSYSKSAGKCKLKSFQGNSK